MLGWFKKKKTEEVPLESEQIINNYLGPTIALAELAEDIARYFKRVPLGTIQIPFYEYRDQFFIFDKQLESKRVEMGS
jgi:hypothetical protein